MATSTYPIRAAAKLAGLTTDTLRAWERRYSAVTPVRGTRGRLYSEAQVARLRSLRDAVAAGHAIGQVASLSDNEIRELIHGGHVSETAVPDGRPSEKLTEQTLSRVLASLERYDAGEAEAELSKLATLLAPREFVLDVVLPLLRRVGEAWHAEQLHVAHEHMLSEILRSLLGALMRLYQPRAPMRRILIATPSGEMHAFGILTAALLAAGQGIGIVYLGADLPAKEILRAVKKTRVDVLLLGMTRTRGNAKSIYQARWLAERLPKGTKLWVGGRAQAAFKKQRATGQMVLLDDFGTLEKALDDFAAGMK